ncbi:hypothetical protein QYE73_19745 [Pseudomonas mosselii]|uniref:hypothetical protein n=1 Tax=Pseudomonas mosselii TaxID=78327 RepID=UPI00262F1A24|nr:hypothetical protein [Pseudomonas mosselii]MDN4499526.1 hypothetical protein [Pseudomonas mosselii]
MTGQRGIVLLLALILSLLFGLLATLALREAILQQRQAGDQQAGARAFEQAEAALIEGAELLAGSIPPRCQACPPPSPPDTQPSPPWLATRSGFVYLQTLGDSLRVAGQPVGDRLTLVRVTAVGLEARGRQLLEAVYAIDGDGAVKRISWRQRLEEG